MNFLAHAYLSYEDPEVLIGNMIADFVKGQKWKEYPAGIRKGIQLHRSIDQFTDQHPVTRQLRAIFRPDYGLYSGVFLDVVYDHFLARDEDIFSGNGLFIFAHSTYEILQAHFRELPPVFQETLAYMRKQNWLFEYREKQGIWRSFRGIVHRAKYLTDANPAYRQFEKQYFILERGYTQFFPDLVTFVKMTLRDHS
ncbi:MAG: acyl carrier protein phosphodiesterase [Chitinophagaceae bacterium]